MEEINKVSIEKIGEIIKTYKPLGLFLGVEGKMFIAVDNLTGEAWTEEFKEEQDAIDYLNGKSLYLEEEKEKSIETTIQFILLSTPNTDQTEVWEVRNQEDMQKLGMIRWDPDLKQYVFWSGKVLKYTKEYLDSIGDFMETLTEREKEIKWQKKNTIKTN